MCISNLLTGDFRNDDGPFVLITPVIEVRRVVLVGYIRDEPSGMEKYAKTTLDDSMGVIDLRAWGGDTKLILKLKQGMFVRVIGKVRFYNGMIYNTLEPKRRLWFARQEKQVENLESEHNTFHVEFM
jgi:RPA family protein